MFYYEDEKLKISRFLKILTLNEKEIRIIMKDKRNINIKGEGLYIDYLEDRELVISGSIAQINIE